MIDDIVFWAVTVILGGLGVFAVVVGIAKAMDDDSPPRVPRS